MRVWVIERSDAYDGVEAVVGYKKADRETEASRGMNRGDPSQC